MTRPSRLFGITPIISVASLGGSGGNIDGTDPSGSLPPSGQIPTSTGSNTWAWGSNVAIITSNSSNQLLGPFVNFASGANISFAAASNTLTISSTGTGGGGGSGTFVGAKAYRTSTLTVSTATETAIGFDSEEYDTDAFHDTSSNNSRFTVPTGMAGKYLLNAGGLNDGAGAPELRLRLNGTTYIRGGDAGSGVTSVRPVTSAVVDLVVGDYVEVVAYQTSGGNATWGHATLRESQLAMSVTLLAGGSGGGGGGAPTTVQYVVLSADATLSNERVRADLYKYDPDNTPTTAVAVGHEYNDGGHNGFTWAASDPSISDVTTYPGYLWASETSTVRWYNKTWSPGATDITIEAAVHFSTVVNAAHIGLYVAGATGNDPQDLVMAQVNVQFSAATFVDFFNRNTGTFAQIGSTVTVTGDQATSGSQFYLRVTRVNAGPTWTMYYSRNGIIWNAMATTGSKSLTVAAIGLRCVADSGTPEFLVPHIRGWASVISKIGS